MISVYIVKELRSFKIKMQKTVKVKVKEKMTLLIMYMLFKGLDHTFAMKFIWTVKH